jgi:3-isopropylmalate dehydrogenase
VRSYRIAVLPGDGIGPEIVREAVKVLRVIEKKYDVRFEVDEALVGGASIDICGSPLKDDVLTLARESDAVLLGAVGGPKWEDLDYSKRPERALLTLRKELGLFANLRPANVCRFLVDASTLKREVIEGVDVMVVRELTGGLYFGTPKGIERLPNGEERGFNTMTYTTSEIERIAKVAFDVALKRKKKVTSIDKANILETTELWRKVVTDVHKDYPEIELNHMYVDNCAMQLVRNPKQFDVILTENTFGDILSDEAAMLTGSIGMLPSASIGGNVCMYEPIHGSAPDIARENKANPIATILSVAMMFRFSFNMIEEAGDIEGSVEKVLEKDFRTEDIYEHSKKLVGCKEMGDAISSEIAG